MYALGVTDVVRVKAQLVDEADEIRNMKEFHLDPQITTFEMLQSLLATAFDLKGDFLISYRALDHENSVVELSLLNDWDLDAAFLSSSRPSLQLKVQPQEASSSLEDWEVVLPCEVPQAPAHPEPTEDIPPPPRRDTLIDKLSGMLGRRVKTEWRSKRPKLPMLRAEFLNYTDSDGRFINERAFRESVYQGGIDPSLRQEAWKHLLNIFPPDLTARERTQYVMEREREYKNLREGWKQMRKNEFISDEMRFITSMVRKDVIRTDRGHAFYKGKDDSEGTESLFDLLCTYSINHPEVSYCQGMSDIASVMLIVQKNETMAYLCFSSLMRRLKYNFLFDGKAMQCKFDHLKLLLAYYDAELWTYLIENDVNDLFFTYRWLLLELKREFPFNESLRILEIMWSTLPSDASPTGIPLTEIINQDTTTSQLSNANTTSTQSAISNTPTPYTKLKALCRQGSNKSTPPIAKHEVEGDKSNSHYCDTDGCGKSECKELSGHPKELVQLNENEAGSSESVQPKSGSTKTSSIESDMHVSVSFSDLQFELESSDTDHKPKARRVFPPPHDFGFGNPFLMFSALTMILQHREHIISNQLDFDSIVLLFDRSVRRNDVNKILNGAKILYHDYVTLDQASHDCDSGYTVSV